MQYRFKGFEFDCQELLLVKNGSVVKLNEKALQLLAFFIKNNDTILTKEVILDAVWQDRVVTEQVVFQNISLLRSTLGDDVLQTFPKRGYQWQCPLEQVISKAPEECAENPVEFSSTKNTHALIKKRSINKWVVITAFAIAILGTAVGLLNIKVSESHLSHSVHLVEKQDVYTAEPLTKANVLADIDVQALFDSPYTAWQAAISNSSQLLVGSRWYPLPDGGVLRFHIQGENRGWRDYIESKTYAEAYEQLSYLVAKLSQTRYFRHQDRYQSIAELVLLSSDKPFMNTLIARQKIILLTQLKDLQRARVIAEQQQDMTNSNLQHGLLLLALVDIDQLDDYWDRANSNNERAITIFRMLAIPHLEAEALIKSSWGHLVDQTFLQGMDALNQAASIARTSKEPLLEVNARLIQAFLASKTGKNDLMHTQQSLARELIKLHQMPKVHNIALAYNLAWSAVNEDKALSGYQNILRQPYTPLYESRFYTAAESVRDMLIEQQSWEEALQSIKPWQRLSFQLLTKAKVAYAQQLEEAETYAFEAFQEALITRERIDALDAALLVLSVGQKNSPAVHECSEYIAQHATRRWKKINRDVLLEFNLPYLTRLN
ncbi:hypothetical protein tloyanaT_11640 [Thalassotalea loyana]|uniref:OmpR/PhoB-type domain-containing protein n=1 Tax=Thalassotalea loyana TaxID=280483 RepID=A0ABQ6H9V7_9GAMM|nr:winged helix-turn-helix domain-containing protein [Thalassotalea loyana]GLX84912.1 hypothetical protein tloyanaT_11640 [Thalassotalea loyana]